MTEQLSLPLEHAARLHPDRLAVVDGDVCWTYAELRRRAAAFDAGLDALGLAAGDVVAVLALNSAEHLLAWHAIPRSGRVVNDLNVRLALPELQFLVEDSGARVLLVDDAFADAGLALAQRCAALERVVHIGRGPVPAGCMSLDALLGSGEPAPPRRVDRDAVAAIFYTGGTTGRPKGVMLTHRNLVANAKHVLVNIGYEEDDVYLHAAPMFHVADAASTFALTWRASRHVIVPAFEPQAVLEAITAQRVTRLLLVPTMIAMLLEQLDPARHDTSSVRVTLYGGSPIPEDVLRRAMAALGCEFVQSYGMTEAAPILTVLTAADHRAGVADPERAHLLRSAGRPIVGAEVEVRRADGTPADVGETGELHARGPNIMRGYWNRAEETAKALDDDGWYRTGDAGYQDADGYLYVVDRVKDMIVSGGENVYSVEVENALHSHPDVVECAVFGVPDERWGERVHAVVVLRAGATADADGLVAHCRGRIAGYKLPRSIELSAEPLPKSGAGKVLKADLRAPHWAGRERQVT